MTNTQVTLDGVSCILPDGRTLFSDIHASFHTRRIGLVGRNGVGKSVLARMVAGLLPPSAGRILTQARMHYLAQEPARGEGDTAATIAGIAPVMRALARIASGSVDPRDYDTVGTRWDINEIFEATLVTHGLAHLKADTPAWQLSGGEASRVAFMGALLSEADILVLDEPSNHLDIVARGLLMEKMDEWPGGMIVISHDRKLLRRMDCIAELAPSGLRMYGGDYDFYAMQSAQERASALRELGQLKAERRNEERAIRDVLERAERRIARGLRSSREANQAPILLGRQKERSQATAGRLRERQAAQRAALNEQVSEAARRVETRESPSLRLATGRPTRFRLAMLKAVRLAHGAGPGGEIDLLVTAGQRIALTGPNGSGKSTLLRTLADMLPPLSGERYAWAPMAYLDQQLSTIDPDKSPLTLIQSANPTMTPTDARARLSQIGVDAASVTAPSGLLSGGQRLAVGIALAIYADPPAVLLLLDEPANHLDLESLQALEDMLRAYDGSLVVASHDEDFLERIGVSERLTPTPEGWRRGPW